MNIKREENPVLKFFSRRKEEKPVEAVEEKVEEKTEPEPIVTSSDQEPKREGKREFQIKKLCVLCASAFFAYLSRSSEQRIE